MAEYTEGHVERVRHMTEGDINGELDRMLRDDPFNVDALPMISAFAALRMERQIAEESKRGFRIDTLIQVRYGGVRLPRLPLEILTS